MKKLLAPLRNEAHRKVSAISYKAIDSEIEECRHLFFVIDGPHVHFNACSMHSGDEARGCDVQDASPLRDLHSNQPA